MAMLMITGAKVGSMIGRPRAFMVGCVIYGGSLTTALAPNLPVQVDVAPLRLWAARGHARCGQR
jgi:hypothetical protein